MGGIELADAYSCIKAISKKKLAMIAKFREEFIDGAATARARARSKADDLFEHDRKVRRLRLQQIAQSRPTRLIAYMTAYLKAHYPVEFMAALLSGDIHGPQLQEQGPARRAPGRLPADGHRGRAAGRELVGGRFHRRRRQDLFGLAAIKGCGGAAAEAIVSRAKPADRSASLFDFCERVDPSGCNRHGDRNA